MKWKAKLVMSILPACPVYWSLTNDKKELRIAINVYKADKATLKEAKVQVRQLLEKLNS